MCTQRTSKGKIFSYSVNFRNTQPEAEERFAEGHHFSLALRHGIAVF